jgi:hypothetical protein
MKYIKTFEYQVYTTSGTLGKMYSGRFTDTLSKHCMMLDRRGIEYELFVDEDELKSNQDVVFIVIKDDYKQDYFEIFKLLGFKSINTKDIKNLTKFNSMRDYLKTKKLNEELEEGDYNNLIYPVDHVGVPSEGKIIDATDEEIDELKIKNFVLYNFDAYAGIGNWEYCEDDLEEIEDYLDFIRSAEYKDAKRYNL